MHNKQLLNYINRYYFLNIFLKFDIYYNVKKSKKQTYIRKQTIFNANVHVKY